MSIFFSITIKKSFGHFFSAIDFAEDDVERSDDGDDVGQHQVLADVVEKRQVGEAGGLNLAPATTKSSFYQLSIGWQNRHSKEEVFTLPTRPSRVRIWEQAFETLPY